MILFAQMEIEQIVWLVTVILFFIGPAVWKVVMAVGGQGKNAPPAALPDQQQQQPPRPAAAEAGDDISQFLRAAAGRRGKPQQKEVRRQQQQAHPRKQRPAERPVEAVVVERQQFGGSVSEHVSQHIGGGELGQKVARTEQDREERRHQVFDHQLGTLSDRTELVSTSEEAGEEFPIAAAAGLAAILSDSDSIRQAIVINEILTRPEDRWA
jgi:hypothetical protein